MLFLVVLESSFTLPFWELKFLRETFEISLCITLSLGESDLTNYIVGTNFGDEIEVICCFWLTLLPLVTIYNLFLVLDRSKAGNFLRELLFDYLAFINTEINYVYLPVKTYS